MQPDPSQAVAFFSALFKPGDLIHFRAVPEPKDAIRTPSNHHYYFDDNFPKTIADFLGYCYTDSRAAFFLPAVARAGKTHKDAVVSMPAIVVDFDRGNPAENLARLEHEIGPASIIVESGGETEHGPKLHAYWLIEQSATGAEIGKLCAIRERLALQFGGDPAFKQEAQVIRIPGSIHLKGEPKLVRLRAIQP